MFFSLSADLMPGLVLLSTAISYEVKGFENSATKYTYWFSAQERERRKPSICVLLITLIDDSRTSSR